MSVQDTTRRKSEVSRKAEPSSGEREAEAHVPEWAEDMEHTLKRLAKDKQAKRDKQPGLYR